MPESVFSLGGSRFQRESNKNRCLWREFAFMRSVVSQAVNPRLGVLRCVNTWREISAMLRENPRKRKIQMDLLFHSLKNRMK